MIMEKDKFNLLFDQIENIEWSSDINERVLIIDGLNMFIRVFSVVPTISETGFHVGGITGFLKSLGAIIRKFKPTRCVIVFDGKGGSHSRRKLYPDYKKNRSISKGLVRSFEYSSKDEELKSMKYQFAILLGFLQHLPINLISFDHVEADDVIAYLSTTVFKKSVTICSTDKDFLQLINININIWNPVKSKLYNKVTLFEEFGITSENFILYKICINDTSDNIKGVNGVGLKTLIKNVPMLTEYIKYTVDDLIEHCKNNLDSKKTFYKKIVDNQDILKLNYKLMELISGDLISGQLKSKLRTLEDIKPDPLQKREFMKLFIQHNFTSVMPNVDYWLINSFNHLNSYALNG